MSRWWWKAQNTITGELCEHKHHSIESATRCGEHIFGVGKCRAVRYVEGTGHAEGGNRPRWGKHKVKKKKPAQSYRYYRKSDVRGIVRFDKESEQDVSKK